MSDIKIQSRNGCSNRDALEAVCGWMDQNYYQRQYQRERNVITKSGGEYKVVEVNVDDDLTSCNGTFEVTKVG